MAKIKDAKDKVSSTFEARQNIKTPEEETPGKSTSLLRKSDLSVIFIGAGIITVVVFFMLFRPDKGKTSMESSTATVDIQSLEERIKALEALVAEKGNEDEATTENTLSLDLYKARVERVEEALSVKFDLVATRLSVLENKIEEFNTQLEKSAKVRSAPKAAANSAVPVKKAVVKTAKATSKPVHKVASHSTTSKSESKSVPKGSIIHKVKKGETLYGISKQYKTTVAKLRALNKLGDKAGIFPGDNLVVR